MARQTKPLSVKEIESAKPNEADYVLYDGDGLELLIKSSGVKSGNFATFAPSPSERKEHWPTRQLRLPMLEAIGQNPVLFLRNKSIPGNISKNNCVVRLKPKLILSSSWQNVGGM